MNMKTDQTLTLKSGHQPLCCQCYLYSVFHAFKSNFLSILKKD